MKEIISREYEADEAVKMKISYHGLTVCKNSRQKGRMFIPT